MIKKTRTEKTGRFINEYSLEHILNIMGTYPTTSAQIRAKLGCHSKTLEYKMNALLLAGQVRRERAGNIWIWQRVSEPEPCQLNNAHMEVEG